MRVMLILVASFLGLSLMLWNGCLGNKNASRTMRMHAAAATSSASSAAPASETGTDAAANPGD